MTTTRNGAHRLNVARNNPATPSRHPRSPLSRGPFFFRLLINDAVLRGRAARRKTLPLTPNYYSRQRREGFLSLSLIPPSSGKLLLRCGPAAIENRIAGKTHFSVKDIKKSFKRDNELLLRSRVQRYKIIIIIIIEGKTRKESSGRSCRRQSKRRERDHRKEITRRS